VIPAKFYILAYPLDAGAAIIHGSCRYGHYMHQAPFLLVYRSAWIAFFWQLGAQASFVHLAVKLISAIHMSMLPRSFLALMLFVGARGIRRQMSLEVGEDQAYLGLTLELDAHWGAPPARTPALIGLRPPRFLDFYRKFYMNQGGRRPTTVSSQT
jgi:hypothetical protein